MSSSIQQLRIRRSRSGTTSRMIQAIAFSAAQYNVYGIVGDLFNVTLANRFGSATWSSITNDRGREWLVPGLGTSSLRGASMARRLTQFVGHGGDDQTTYAWRKLSCGGGFEAFGERERALVERPARDGGLEAACRQLAHVVER